MSKNGYLTEGSGLSEENNFLIFAVEYYRSKKNLSGQQVAELFSKHGIYQMIIDNYFLYHIESPDNLVAEIDGRAGC